MKRGAMNCKNIFGFTTFLLMAMFLIQGCSAKQNNIVQTKSDLEITQDIRQAIIADESLSMYAHNVKIISENGIVKLRGPVRSAQEEMIVLHIASHVDGKIKVIDQMSIASK